MKNHHGSRSAKVINVIEVKTAVGKGTESDPCRIITEYWSLDGNLLAVNNPKITPPEEKKEYFVGFAEVAAAMANLKPKPDSNA